MYEYICNQGAISPINTVFITKCESLFFFFSFVDRAKAVAHVSWEAQRAFVAKPLFVILKILRHWPSTNDIAHATVDGMVRIVNSCTFDVLELKPAFWRRFARQR